MNLKIDAVTFYYLANSQELPINYPTRNMTEFAFSKYTAVKTNLVLPYMIVKSQSDLLTLLSNVFLRQGSFQHKQVVQTDDGR